MKIGNYDLEYIYTDMVDDDISDMNHDLIQIWQSTSCKSIDPASVLAIGLIDLSPEQMCQLQDWISDCASKPIKVHEVVEKLPFRSIWDWCLDYENSKMLHLEVGSRVGNQCVRMLREASNLMRPMVTEHGKLNVAKAILNECKTLDGK